MSEFAVEVVPIKLESHPDADKLSVVYVNGFTVVVNTEAWQGHEIAAYIPPDSICPDTPEFAFLEGKRLIRARKLRGVPSFGLLTPAPAGSKVGDNVADILGITHYEPPVDLGKFSQGEAEAPPKQYAPCYDLENARKYNRVFQTGELVNCLEKIHGQNWRGFYDAANDKMMVGSRTEWKRYDEKNVFWKSLEFTPAVEAFCRANPDCILYGESAGNVQKGYPYGVPAGETRIFAFDVLRDGEWMNYKDAKALTEPYGVTWCPAVAEEIPYDFNTICELAEGKTLVPGANHIREGIVVSPIAERNHIKIGRVKLKFVSLAYLAKK